MNPAKAKTTGPDGPKGAAPLIGAHPARFALLLPNATVFVSGFCVMVIELVAGRIVSRNLGSSIYTWTSVIGVVLAGLALGNYAGGRLADRYRPRRTLAVLFGASSALCVSIVLLDGLVGEWVLLYGLPWPLRVALHVTFIFFLPTFMLGTISPVVAKMALDLGRETGRTIGNIYAWGVAGSIAGTFLTGYLLIAVLGTRAIIWLVAGTLALIAAGYAPIRRGISAWLGIFAVLALLGNGSWDWARAGGVALALRDAPDDSLLYQSESRYARITVRRDLLDPDRRFLFLDKLLHSQIRISDPLDLQYDYERLFAALTRRLAAGRPDLATLTIGGGGYVFPRFLEANWPQGRTVVVEIDPAVTAAARAAFGLSADSRIEIQHEDGRVFVNRMARMVGRGKESPLYDIVYVDAFTDYTVPYQVTTLEFYDEVRRLLRGNGACLVNMIDIYSSGRLLAALLATLESVFPNTAVLAEGEPWKDPRPHRSTFVAVGSLEPIDMKELGEAYRPGYTVSRLPEEERKHLLARVRPRVLTDDHAPVEQLLAPTVRASALSVAVTSLLQKAVRFTLEGRIEACGVACREVLSLQSDNYRAHHMLANVLLQQGHIDQAIDHWRRALASHPDFPDAHHNLGAALCRSNHLAEGMRHLREALRLEPDHVLAHNSLGLALEQLGRIDEAIEHYQAALRARPDFSQARANLQRAQARQ